MGHLLNRGAFSIPQRLRRGTIAGNLIRETTCMSDQTTLRKQPTTERGQRRVNKILDATADLLVEMGYANITTNHIADRAETSVGSLYQFFKNKDAVLEALADRYLTELETSLTAFAETDHNLSLPDLIVYFVEGTLKFYTENPGFEPLFFGAVKSESMQEIGRKAYATMVAMVEQLFAQYHPQADASERHAQAHLIVSLCKLQLPHRHNLPQAMRDDYIRQVKAAAAAYVATL